MKISTRKLISRMLLIISVATGVVYFLLFAYNIIHTKNPTATLLLACIAVLYYFLLGKSTVPGLIKEACVDLKEIWKCAQ